MAEAEEPLIAPTVQPTIQPTEVSAVEAEIRRVFGKNADGFIYILTTCRENTTLNPLAINDTNTDGSIDVGVGQVNTRDGVRFSNNVKYTIEELKDYRINIKVSYEIFERQGWGAWYGCKFHNNGIYPPTY